MKAIELRNKYLNFFKSKGHTIIPSSSLIPDNDPSVLFTTAGMHPLVPYLLGEEHPGGKRLTDYQKCLRTDDIEEVGDTSHLTYFEMMGNWSLGDYFKKESIAMSYEFLTKELGIPSEKISVTCFAGDDDCKRDNEAAEFWEKAGIPKERIFFFGKKENWWGPAGTHGPCGPDTEIFYDTGKEKCCENCNPACSCGKYLEIWNNVFMQYNKTEDGRYEELKQKNVDTGLGLERTTMILSGKENVFEIEVFKPIIDKLNRLATNKNDESYRIIADHLRASLMLISDGVKPSNIEQGYILRRLIRRAIRHLRKLGINTEELRNIAKLNIDTIKNMYPELEEKQDMILDTLDNEKNKFIKTLENGEKEFEKILNKIRQQGKDTIDAVTAFKLYETYGFPIEITEELAKENGLKINSEEVQKLYKEHQEKSRLGAEQKFKGGLAEKNEETICYHTATHLLHKALKIVLGDHVAQKGSNITTERLRFDFSHPQKLTPEELKKVEDIVNEQIQRDLPVVCEEMTLEEAKKSGAIGLFENKYGDRVKVYTIGDFSKEICGGPHVEHTGQLGKFVIKKEEASSAGVRRIKAILIR